MSYLSSDRKWWQLTLISHFLCCAVERQEHCKQIPLGFVGIPCSEWKAQGLPKSKVMCTSQIQPLTLLMLHEGTVPGWPCVSCTSQAQTAQIPRCSMKGQSQVSHVCPTLPRPNQSRLPRSLPGHSPRCVLCLLHFPGLSCSDSWVFSEIPVPVEPYISCSS